MVMYLAASAGPTWQPVADATPIFQRYRPDEATLKALTLTQVELHQLRTAHQRLTAQARHDQQNWERQKKQMEDELRQTNVRSSEAERLFNDHMTSLLSLLQSKQEKMDQIQLEHDELRGAATGTIQAMQQRLEDLQGSCDELQARKAQLQEDLHNAGVSVELGRRAQQRVVELESAIDATQQRAKDMISNLQRQQEEVESHREHLQHRLQSTQSSLQSESELRSQSETQVLQLAIQRQRLSNALEVERLINAPLRQTDYASTTLAHVLRSAAGPTVAAHSRSPHSPHRLSPASPGGQHVPLSEDAVTVAWTGSNSPSTVTVRRPSVGQSFVERDLTRLGRAWATTTPTAGLPHTPYLDNIARFREHYDSVGGQQRRSSLSRKAGDRGPSVFSTPVQQRKHVEDSEHSTGKTLCY